MRCHYYTDVPCSKFKWKIPFEVFLVLSESTVVLRQIGNKNVASILRSGGGMVGCGISYGEATSITQ